MAQTSYIADADRALYGVGRAVDDRAIMRASRMLDGFLERPEGLVYSVDAAGAPCFMANATSSQTWKLVGAVSAGSNVSVRLNWTPQKSIIGEMLVLDAGVDGKTEAATVTALDGAYVTLDKLAYDHADAANVAAGLLISDIVRPLGIVPRATLSRRPVVRILGIGFRFGGGPQGLSPGISGGLGRRGYYDNMPYGDDYGLAPVTPASLGSYSIMDPAGVAFTSETGDITPGTGVYAEVRVQYVSGFAAGALPPFVSLATAQIANAMADDVGPYRRYAAGDTSIEKFANSVLSADTLTLLNPLRIGPRL